MARATAVAALLVPVLPPPWRRVAAVALVGLRTLTQVQRLQRDAPAVLLDSASLAGLALSQQEAVVSASVLLRQLAERLSARLVRQADDLLDRLLPTEAAHYPVLRDAARVDTVALAELRAGDRLRLRAGDVVPVDGCVVDGQGNVAPAVPLAATLRAQPGTHLAAGARVAAGDLLLRAEADAAASRLARLRDHVQHAIGARDPAGRLAPDQERLLSLPLTAAGLVFGLTGDTARAAAMLQADPQQGLDLALPVAREAALYALARQGLLTGGLEAIERLASARTLVLQDTGVLACGRWTIEQVRTEPGGDAAKVREWLAALADTPATVLESASLPDALVRQWVRHGAVLRVGPNELHLASPQRLRHVWGLELAAAVPPPPAAPLRRELAVVAAGRVVAQVTLASALRAGAAQRLQALAALGFEQLAVFVESDGCCIPVLPAQAGPGPRYVADDRARRRQWLAEQARDGEPLVLVHTTLRDLLPPGSLSLSPMDSDAGSHGVLLDDPLASLVAARHVARVVHRRLRLQQGSATALNAALMAASALRWLPPMGTALVHHGFALLLLLDSLRVERIEGHPHALRADPSLHAP
jgi:cation transport ATPase